jgi:hypothetical protein
MQQREAQAPIHNLKAKHALGDLDNVTLDPHAARGTNFHRKTLERINIPED